MKRGRTGDSRVVRKSLIRVAADDTLDYDEVLQRIATKGHCSVVSGPEAGGVCYHIWLENTTCPTPWGRLNRELACDNHQSVT